jgi:hypothetical protein
MYVNDSLALKLHTRSSARLLMLAPFRATVRLFVSHVASGSSISMNHPTTGEEGSVTVKVVAEVSASSLSPFAAVYAEVLTVHGELPPDEPVIP